MMNNRERLTAYTRLMFIKLYRRRVRGCYIRKRYVEGKGDASGMAQYCILTCSKGKRKLVQCWYKMDKLQFLLRMG